MTIKRRRADHKGKRQAVQRRCLCPLVSVLSFRFVAAGAGLRRGAAHLLLSSTRHSAILIFICIIRLNLFLIFAIIFKRIASGVFECYEV